MQIATTYAIELVFVQKITLILRKINKKRLPPELLFLTPIYTTKSFVGWGFTPDPTGRALQRSPRPLAVFRGPKGRGGGRQSSSFALGRKRKVGAYI